MDKLAYYTNTISMDKKHSSGVRIMFDQKVKTMIEDIASLLNVKITFFSLDKEESLVGCHSTKSDFCTLLQEKLGKRDKCILQDERALSKCKEQNKTLIYHCHAGLTEIIIPIKNKEIFAFAIIGQFRMRNALDEKIIKKWREKGYDSKTLEKAFLERPLFNKEQVEKISSLLDSIISMQIETESLRVKRPDLIEKACCYITDNIANEITLASISKELSKSSSSIEHEIKKATGKSFKELLINMRLSRFEAIVRKNPNIAIKDASYQVGYKDSLYFSRLYKKKKGITPSEYIKLSKY